MHLLICQTLTSQEKPQPYETPQTKKHLVSPDRFESFWCVAAQVTWDFCQDVLRLVTAFWGPTSISGSSLRN